MDPTTLRLPEDTLAELDSEYSDYGYGSRSDYIRAIIEHRDPPFADDATTSATTPDYGGPTTDDYERLRNRADELEARLDGIEDELAQTANETLDMDAGEVALSASDPYPEAVETGLALVRDADRHVPKRAILDAVPDEDISEESLWQRHIRPALRESDAEHTRNKGWLWTDESEE